MYELVKDRRKALARNRTSAAPPAASHLYHDIRWREFAMDASKRFAHDTFGAVTVDRAPEDLSAHNDTEPRHPAPAGQRAYDETRAHERGQR